MGMDLYGTGGYFRFNNAGWRQVLTLAQASGWEPRGTEVPNREDFDASWWDGAYLVNSGQRVTDEDAKAIAEALKEALDDVPNHDAIPDIPLVPPDGGDFQGARRLKLNAPKAVAEELSDTLNRAAGQDTGMKYSIVPSDEPDDDAIPHLTPHEYFSGPRKEYVRKFIAYCEKGGFRIW